MPQPFSGRSALYDSTVETLLQLAYSHLAVDDRSTHAPALNFLERCFPLLLTPSSQSAYDLDAHYSIRSLASSCYNMAGKLFNAGKPDTALGFAKRAAELSQGVHDCWRAQAETVEDALSKLSLTDGKEQEVDEKAQKRRKERDDAMRELGEKYLSKRWELLALCQHSVGDKTVRRLSKLALAR